MNADQEEGTSVNQPTYEAIARRAYEIAHNGHGGTDEENWLRAEQELLEGSSRAGSAEV